VRIYVINLERSTDRRDHMASELARLGLDYELVPGVDGRKLDLSSAQIVRPGQPGQSCSPLWAQTWNLPGVAGCALSHLLVCQRVIASGDNAALVLEDDVTLADDLAEVVNAIERYLVGAEVVLLNFDSRGRCQLSANGTKPLRGQRVLALPLDVNEPLSAAGYIITSEACRRMVERMMPARAKPDDWAFFYDHRVIDRLQCVVPMPVQKSPRFTSTILYDPGTIKARLRGIALAMARRLSIVERVLIVRRSRIWGGIGIEVVDAPFVHKPSRLDKEGERTQRWERS
jgi:glycosyl transferase family 25